MNKTYKQISIVIPVYNELKSIERLITRIGETLEYAGIEFELIFVDDHSTDGTYEYLHRYVPSKSVKLLQKKGKKGKAYSLLEGFAEARYDAVAMIDADLQYPPEMLPRMISKLASADIVVANRKDYKGPSFRRLLSRGFRYLFGGMLFGIRTDIQSGMKVFTKEVIQTISFAPSSGWTFDLEFLYRAQEAGFVIKDVPITFAPREQGMSHVHIASTIADIGLNSLKLKMKRIPPQVIRPTEGMVGAGVGFKRKKYVTHTTLPHQLSALRTVSTMQKWLLLLLFLGFLASLIFYTIPTIIGFVAVLSVIYFIDTVFNLFIISKSLQTPSEVQVSKSELAKLSEKDLPTYTILCPLYKEAHIIPHFLQSIDRLDWPKNKLDVILLLEEDDPEAKDVAGSKLPSYVRAVMVPESQPKTKPKACNYGLSLAKGDYLVIYDAEDMPDPDQLKKAYIAFAKTPKETICLQAKLNYYNPHQNILTRFFTAEYSLWFDVTLAGLQSLNTAMPLGGTSNHFKTADLMRLQGWDPFNVTEDADLGVRLFQKGYRTAIVDSTTLEEANSAVGNWLRQRSRWLKGYMQTYLVHMRQTFKLAREQGYHAFLMHLIIGGKIAFILINPFLWITTISYFAFYAQTSTIIESIYGRYVFYIAVFSMVFGNFLFLYYCMIGAVKRGHFSLVKYVYLIPLYWIMLSIAAFIALYQLLFKPHYWEKTVHGLHLGAVPARKIGKKVVPALAVSLEGEGVIFPSEKKPSFSLPFLSGKALTGVMLVGVTGLASVVNFVFNTYLYRTISLSDFALVSLLGGIFAIASIPFAAISSTVSHQTGFLEGKEEGSAGKMFWSHLRWKMLIISIVVAGLWIVGLPLLQSYFHTKEVLLFLSFTAIWLFGFSLAVDRGFLMGKLLFGSLAVVILVEPLTKLGVAYAAVTGGLGQYAYAAIPASIIATIFCSFLIIARKVKSVVGTKRSLSKKFFFVSLLSGLSTVSFVGLDIVLANHYLSPEDAGQYAFISLVGKIVFFLGTMTSQFIIPVVSRNEGKNVSSKRIMQLILLTTALLTFSGFVFFGVFADVTLPLLFGERARFASEYMLFFLFAMMSFSLSKVFTSFYLAKRMYSFPVASFLLTIALFALIALRHQGIGDFVASMLIIGGLNLVLMITMHLGSFYIKVFEANVKDFLGLFGNKHESVKKNGLRILIFNWRDMKHKWAGGAEVYAHELAKRFVKDGNSVTIFCGNDGDSARNDEIDGVVIKRRGGAYLVYLWAFLYYVLRFRGKFDVVIDCENGLPFFTPFFVRKPIFLVIHHVHQQVFREHLMFPFSHIAAFMEGVVMPFVYRNRPVITVSESSRKAIAKMMNIKPSQIYIVHNGIDQKLFKQAEKAPFPLFSYVGRLKAYKNIDVAISAFARVLRTSPDARLYIAGWGEMERSLKKQVKQLGIEHHVVFFGKVTDREKAKILAKSWALLQPSMMEGWGITVIEANASGTPVIASNVSGLKDAVIDGSTGLLVASGDAKALAKEMHAFIKDSRYRRLLAKQALIWSSHFDWDYSADSFYRIIASYMQDAEQGKYVRRFVLAKEAIDI